MILAILLGLAIGLALGSLGGGGSILAVPVLVHVAGQSVGAATATSLVAVGTAAAVGALGHGRAGHLRWGAAAIFIATGIPGSWLGSQLNPRIDDNVLLLAFSALVLVAAHRMLTACPSCTNVGEQLALAADGSEQAAGAGTTTGSPVNGTNTAARTIPTGTSVSVSPTATATRSLLSGLRGGAIARMLIAGSLVGFLTGLFGVGGGFVIVPALTLALGLSMPAAIGTSLIVIVGNATVALAFRGVDAVDWSIAFPFTATMIVGSLVGSLIAHRLPAKHSLQAFAGLLVVVAVANGAAALVGLVG